MSVKNFKFVSPGVFINEIDNSFIPRSAQAIGPVVIGRSTRGLGMTPVKVESYSEFVEMFGDTVPGNSGGDISRYGNFQSPMYGTYAAKAFLDANVAPLTYVRLLGEQDSGASSDGIAGWETTKDVSDNHDANGGAYGLFVFASASTFSTTQLGEAQLGAIFYVNSGSYLALSGNMVGSGTADDTNVDLGRGTNVAVMTTTSDYTLKMQVSGADGSNEVITFGFDDSQESFLRKKFNTNPQLTSTPGTFYPSSAEKRYWLGESYEQTLRDNSMTSAMIGAVLLPVALDTNKALGPQEKRQASQEGRSGWFIGQDLGQPNSFSIEAMTKLFRLVGRGHAAWLHRNCKVSIENLRASTISTSDYGTFSVVIRNVSDSDNNVEIMERFDNCTLDPSSTNFVARMIGDQYVTWSTTDKRLKTYGDYPNQSKFVYVDMNADVEAGATDPLLLPFGYFGPPRFKGMNALNTGSNFNGQTTGYIYSGSVIGENGNFKPPSGAWRNSTLVTGSGGNLSGSLAFPYVRLRLSASDGGLSDPTKAYFGMQTTRTADDTRNDPSVPDFHNLLKGGFAGGGGSGSPAGIADHAYVFSMDDIVASGSSYFWRSGSRAAQTAVTTGSYTNLLDAGYDSFTAPFFGGFDGFDIKVPDPMYNKGIPGAGGSETGTATDENSYPYYTWKRAIDTVADPEAINMNLLAAPGLTVNSLTQHMVNTCEDRADSLALIDLSSVYIPPHEAYYSDKSSRIGTTPQTAATALRNRGMDSSYGATFYPWVQTADEATGRLLWIPPSIAMMGVLASSQRKTAVWFAPAGFNRGGLTDGAAGIPVLSVSERLTSKNRDTLYEARINPIASFPSSGIVVFGQKTLQQQRSALDRINVRRLVIYLKKQISILSTKVLFEQNVQATWNRFTSLIEPLLSNVKSQFGITDYKLILDDTTTTPDLIDQNILYAKIMIKPARAIEYIAIDFVIMRTGASFDD